MIRIAVWLVLFSFVLVSSGCQTVGLGPSKSLPGGSDYSLDGKEITPPNQVLVMNPYTFSVKVLWQDKEITLAPHSQQYILFRGMTEPGPIRAWETDASGGKLMELKYLTPSKGMFASGRVYQIV
ncbi:hypothetical protein KW783_01425 [Candidatus Parcubacteria bacterium]|nr:hypothetical protein [Candidatus Parcubacteria bacterium]